MELFALNADHPVTSVQLSGITNFGYFYDALGRRLAKTANGVTTTFVHDGAQVIAEYEAPVFQPKKRNQTAEGAEGAEIKSVWS